jgi:hypothetical protein
MSLSPAMARSPSGASGVSYRSDEVGQTLRLAKATTQRQGHPKAVGEGHFRCGLVFGKPWAVAVDAMLCL